MIDAPCSWQGNRWYALIGGAISVFVLLSLLLTSAACAGKKKYETPTPLGCDEAKRHYYNPSVGQCVIPSAREEALILATFRRVHALSSEGGENVTYRISFVRALTNAEFVTILQDLHVSQVSIVGLDFTNPNESVAYDLPLGTAPEAAARATLDAAIRTHDGGLPALSDAFDAGRFTMWFAEVDAAAADAGAWWDRHWKEVTLMQPITSSVDKLMLPLEPYRENKWER